jgi:hypothetical protein
MRIAFDVMGTIEGPKQKQVLELFSRLWTAGHEMFVWSNLESYAVDAIKKHNLPATSMRKYSSTDAEERGFMDLAIEDDPSQTWLGAKQIVLVSELPAKTEFLLKQFGVAKTPWSSHEQE